jgi:hypothetical protein
MQETGCLIIVMRCAFGFEVYCRHCIARLTVVIVWKGQSDVPAQVIGIDMASEDQNLSSFIAVTGATPEQAQFFLESANGDVDAAVSSFLDDKDPSAALDASGELSFVPDVRTHFVKS